MRRISLAVFILFTSFNLNALIATPLIINHFSDPLPPGEMNEDMLSPIMLVTGMACAAVGISTVMIGSPSTQDTFIGTIILYKESR